MLSVSGTEVDATRLLIPEQTVMSSHLLTMDGLALGWDSPVVCAAVPSAVSLL